MSKTFRIPRKRKKQMNNLLNSASSFLYKIANKDYAAEERERNKIKAGDTVLVYCPLFSGYPTEEVVERIDGDWAIFKGDSGKIQLEYCQKPMY